MSYDLFVAMAKPVSATYIESFIAQYPGLIVTGALREDANMVVEQVTGTSTIPLFTIDGGPAEEDDLPEPLADAIRAVRWSVMISVPEAGRPDGVRLGQALARSLAEECRGAVYDPQTDEIIWPGGRRQQDKSATIKEERLPIIEVKWYFPLSRLGGDTPRRLLDVLGRTVNEAVPRRFDGQRLEPGNEEAFYAFWRDSIVTLSDGFWWWNPVRPYFQGSIYVQRTYVTQGQRTVPSWSLEIPIDGRPVADNSRRREAVREMFVAIAAELGAFYGHAQVVRNYIATRRGLYLDGQTEHSFSDSWWTGIPPISTWLTWFGESYRGKVAEALAGWPVEEYPGGLFLRAAEQPANRDELAGRFPSLPASLVRRGDTSAQHLPDFQ
jgi:hypothetical protein